MYWFALSLIGGAEGVVFCFPEYGANGESQICLQQHINMFSCLCNIANQNGSVSQKYTGVLCPLTLDYVIGTVSKTNRDPQALR